MAHSVSPFEEMMQPLSASQHAPRFGKARAWSSVSQGARQQTQILFVCAALQGADRGRPAGQLLKGVNTARVCFDAACAGAGQH